MASCAGSIARPPARPGSTPSLPRVTEGEIGHTEVLAFVRPDTFHGEAAGLGQVSQGRETVLVGVLGVDRLARGEEERHAADTNDLVAAADEVHFDPPLGGVVEGPVGELLDVEVGAQFAIDPHQDVAVERGRDAPSVVVGGLDHARVLPQIDAEQESAAASTQPRRLSQQGERCLRREVAERRAGEVDHPSGGSLPARGQAQRPREVGAQRQHLDVRVFLAQRPGRAAQVLARDVDGHVTGRVAQLVEEAPGLEAAATAILDEQATRPQQPGHLRRVPLHDAKLGARRVILLQLRDLLEQGRADLVVEVLARQFLLRGTQAAEHVGTELPRGIIEDVGRRQLRDGVDHASSLARRMPLNCQRASGGKKLR